MKHILFFVSLFCTIGMQAAEINITPDSSLTDKMIIGCNQENAAFPAGICAERAAIFAAGAQYPDQPVIALAITARNTKGELIDEPASPCGPCRQVLIETETRFKHPVRILLYGRKRTFVINSIKELMPLSFTEF